jgi:hypothetical protein
LGKAQGFAYFFAFDIQKRGGLGGCKPSQGFAFVQFSIGLTIILDSAVISTHLTQPIDSPGISEETLITNKVTAISSDTPGKSMDYAMHALPTAESRIILST